MESIKLLSLFSGMGAYEKALKNIGISIDIIGYSEIDKYASKSYSLIHGVEESRNYGDVTTINCNRISDFDILVYSPPCQAFSVAGKQLGFEDKRGILFFDAVKIIKNKMPKICIMENVKGLTQKKFEVEFKSMLDILDKTGYNNYWSVLDSKNYTYQHRERLFLVSIRKDIDNKNFAFPIVTNNKKTLKYIIKYDVDKKYYLSDAMIQYIKNKETKSHGFRVEINTINSILKSPLRAQGDKPILKCPKTGNLRKLTPLECMLIMGFSEEDYNALKQNNISDTQIYKMCGNSIDVYILELIFKELINSVISLNFNCKKSIV